MEISLKNYDAANNKKWKIIVVILWYYYTMILFCETMTVRLVHFMRDNDDKLFNENNDDWRYWSMETMIIEDIDQWKQWRLKMMMKTEAFED